MVLGVKQACPVLSCPALPCPALLPPALSPFAGPRPRPPPPALAAALCPLPALIRHPPLPISGSALLCPPSSFPPFLFLDRVSNKHSLTPLARTGCSRTYTPPTLTSSSSSPCLSLSLRSTSLEARSVSSYHSLPYSLASLRYGKHAGTTSKKRESRRVCVCGCDRRARKSTHARTYDKDDEMSSNYKKRVINESDDDEESGSERGRATHHTAAVPQQQQQQPASSSALHQQAVETGSAILKEAAHHETTQSEQVSGSVDRNASRLSRVHSRHLPRPFEGGGEDGGQRESKMFPSTSQGREPASARQEPDVTRPSLVPFSSPFIPHAPSLHQSSSMRPAHRKPKSSSKTQRHATK